MLIMRLVIVSTPSLSNLSSLRNSVLHDASHVGNRKIDILLPVVLFDPTIFMVIQTFISIIYRKHTGTVSFPAENPDACFRTISILSAPHHLETGERSDRMT